jgi:hypothetical protein
MGRPLAIVNVGSGRARRDGPRRDPRTGSSAKAVAGSAVLVRARGLVGYSCAILRSYAARALRSMSTNVL